MRWRAQLRAVLPRVWLSAILAVPLACVWTPSEPLPPSEEQCNQEYLDHLRAELGRPPKPSEQPLRVDPLPRELRANIVIAIDTSGSTNEPSGVDIDGDGRIGADPAMERPGRGRMDEAERNTDPDDSILEAELQGVRTFLAMLGDRPVRAAVISFAGAVDPSTGEQSGSPAENARVVAPLGDLVAASAAVEALSGARPGGGTDFSAALGVSAAILCAISAKDDAPRIVLLVTDGIPSLPHGRGDVSDVEDVEAALDAAAGIATCGGRVEVFTVGPQMLGDPLAARAVARSSGGAYHPVRDARDLGLALRSALVVEP